jgi:hypothetical protein
VRNLLRSLWIFSALIIFTQSWQLRAQHFDHSLLDSLLQAHVDNGLVDYPGLMKDGARFLRYCRQLRTVRLKDFLTWPEKERKAFWLNAHNTISLVGVITHYPTHKSGNPVYYRTRNFSVRSIRDFDSTVFMKLVGMNITLNQIRNEILRDEYRDIRTSFALVYAAKGGPAFPDRAFTAENIDELLDKAIIAFVKNQKYVKLNKETNNLHLSSLFRMHRKEFPVLRIEGRKWAEYSRDLRGVVEFVYQFQSKDDRRFIEKYNPRIRWMKFDWSLNIVPKFDLNKKIKQ